jgi:hypothetical protein
VPQVLILEWKRLRWNKGRQWPPVLPPSAVDLKIESDLRLNDYLGVLAQHVMSKTSPKRTIITQTKTMGDTLHYFRTAKRAKRSRKIQFRGINYKNGLATESEGSSPK